MPQKFKFIVLEGLDCSGKTTLANELAKAMEPAVVFRFPDRTSQTGSVINKYLQKDPATVSTMNPHELHLLFSANRYEKAREILETLEHSNVICDRYWLSGTIYSAAKGLDYEWCKSTDKFLPQPDMSFFLDIDENEVAKRKGFGSEEHDKIEFQQRVYALYKSKIQSEGMVIIDGLADLDAKVSQIINKMSNK